MKPVVFIDVDGVFNRYTFAEGHTNPDLDDVLLHRFAQVIREHDSKVVTLSAFNSDLLKRRMMEHGVDSISVYTESFDRSSAVLRYVGQNNIFNWAVVDDEAIDRWHYYETMPDRLIKVDGRIGFSEEDAHDLSRTLSSSTYWEQGTINRLKNAHKLIDIQKRYIKRLKDENHSYFVKHGKLKS
jgi:hypothetical protein